MPIFGSRSDQDQRLSVRGRSKAPQDLIEILLWMILILATVLMGVVVILPVWDIASWA